MRARAGVVTVKRPIDYETDESLVLVVAAGDDGEPPLSATATVSVQVLNVNDESPMFQNISQVSMVRSGVIWRVVQRHLTLLTFCRHQNFVLIRQYFL